MIRDLVRHSKRLWIIVSAAVVTVSAVIAIARAVVRTDMLEQHVSTVRSDIDTLKVRERSLSSYMHKLDVKLDFVMERLGVPIPVHLRAPLAEEEAAP